MNVLSPFLPADLPAEAFAQAGASAQAGILVSLIPWYTVAYMKPKSPVITSPEAIDEVLSRGVDEVIVKDHLRNRMIKGNHLRVKLGIDPTSPNIHLGRSVALLKLRDFQNLGHTPVLIIGDATGIVGDTSDKESERPMLTSAEVKKNEKNYLTQIGKIIDLKHAEVHHNSTWLNKLKFGEIGDQANQFSVSDFIARDNIKRRLDDGKRVSLREMIYPLMQGYDSVAIKADVEIGGVDQRFNLLAGRVLQKHYGLQEQDIVMGPLLSGTDGRKMSSSWGNVIAITDTPDDMFAKVMRVRDELIIFFFELCTRIQIEKVREYSAQLNAGENPKTIKTLLARELVTMYHDEKTAKKAHENFETMFSKGEIVEEALTEIPVDPGNNLENIIHEHKLLSSKSEFRRLIEGGGVRDIATGEKITDPKRKIIIPVVLKLGKHRFIKIVIKRKPRS